MYADFWNKFYSLAIKYFKEDENCGVTLGEKNYGFTKNV